MNDQIKKGSAATDRQPSRMHLQFNKNIAAADVKTAAKGRWLEILQAAGMPAEALDGRNQPCPRCGGTDRFNASADVEQSGAVWCRKCFNKTTAISPGDGIATLAWWMNLTNGEAIKWLADYPGLAKNDPAAPKPDFIEQLCNDKRMPRAAFEKYGVRVAKRGREKRPVVRVDCYNAAGCVHSYFDLVPGDKGKFKPGKGNAGLFLPGRTPEAGETWLLVEGVKDGSALTELGYLAAGLPSASLPASFSELFRGVNIVLVPDLDRAGQSGARKTASFLFGVASSVKLARLRGEMKETGGADVRDTLRKPGGEKLVREAIESAEAWEPSDADTDEKPQVDIRLPESEVAVRVVEHLGRLGINSPWIDDIRRDAVSVYTRGGVLVQVASSDDLETRGRLSIRDLPACLVRERITDACDLVDIRQDKNGETEAVAVRPPGWVVESIYRRGSYDGRIRPLSGVISAPTIRPSGSVLQTRGYDVETGLFFEPREEFPAVPTSPTQEDAHQALNDLLETLIDFPMLDKADRSAWLAMLLSMIGRSAFTGFCPLFPVTANVRGAGKSLLCDAASYIAFGHTAGRKTFTKDAEELSKVITSICLAGLQAVLFDNLDTPLGGSALESAITATTWEGRILGQSKMTLLPMRTVFSCTGNNVQFAGDIARRVLPIRLYSDCENPEDRTEFRHPNLLAWVKRERPRLACAALTALRAYFVAGCPSQPGGEWGSFENWSAIIRGAIVWSEHADPLPTRQTATAQDESAGLLGRLITGLEKADASGLGMTTKEIRFATFGDGKDDPDNEILAEAVGSICGDFFSANRLANRLSSLRGRIWEGRCIDNASAHGGVKRWRVCKSDGWVGGGGGSKSPRSVTETACVTNNTQNNFESEGIETQPTPPSREHTRVIEQALGKTPPPKPPMPPPEDRQNGYSPVASQDDDHRDGVFV